jgi:hypothetical protein
MLRSSKSGRAQLRRALPMLQDEREGFSYAKLLIVLDVFSEMKLITFSASDDEITFEMDNNIRVDLDNSGLMRRLSGV